MKNRLTLIVVIFTIVLLFYTYIGSYYANVMVGSDYKNIAQDGAHIIIHEDYRVGGRVAEVAYFRINWLDRKLRPDSGRLVLVACCNEDPHHRPPLARLRRPEGTSERGEAGHRTSPNGKLTCFRSLEKGYTEVFLQYGGLTEEVSF